MRRPDTIPDMGEVQLEIYFDPHDSATVHAELEELSEVPVNVNWRLVFNNGTSTRPHRQFNGHVTSFENSGMEKGSDLMASLGIAINGLITHGETTLT
jgi:hypothetical protein